MKKFLTIFIVLMLMEVDRTLCRKPFCTQVHVDDEELAVFQFVYCRNDLNYPFMTSKSTTLTSEEDEIEGICWRFKSSDSFFEDHCTTYSYLCASFVRAVLMEYGTGDNFATCRGVKKPMQAANITIEWLGKNMTAEANPIERFNLSVLFPIRSVHTRILIGCNSSHKHVCGSGKLNSYNVDPAKTGWISKIIELPSHSGTWYEFYAIIGNKVADLERLSDRTYSRRHINAPAPPTYVSIYFISIDNLTNLATVGVDIKTKPESVKEFFILKAYLASEQKLVDNSQQSFTAKEIQDAKDNNTFTGNFYFFPEHEKEYIVGVQTAILVCTNFCNKNASQNKTEEIVLSDTRSSNKLLVKERAKPLYKLMARGRTSTRRIFDLHNIIEATSDYLFTVKCTGLVTNHTCGGEVQLCEEKLINDIPSFFDYAGFVQPAYHLCTFYLQVGEIYKFEGHRQTSARDITLFMLNLTQIRRPSRFLAGNLTYINRRHGEVDEIFDNYKLFVQTQLLSVFTHINIFCIPLGTTLCHLENSKLIPWESNGSHEVLEIEYRFRAYGGANFQLKLQPGSEYNGRIIYASPPLSLNFTSPPVAPLQVRVSVIEKKIAILRVTLSKNSLYTHLALNLHLQTAIGQQFVRSMFLSVESLVFEGNVAIASYTLLTNETSVYSFGVNTVLTECVDNCGYEELRNSVFSLNTTSNTFSIVQVAVTTMTNVQQANSVSTAKPKNSSSTERILLLVFGVSTTVTTLIVVFILLIITERHRREDFGPSNERRKIKAKHRANLERKNNLYSAYESVLEVYDRSIDKQDQIASQTALTLQRPITPYCANYENWYQSLTHVQSAEPQRLSMQQRKLFDDPGNSYNVPACAYKNINHLQH